jgi:hypothetical protein
LSDRDRPEGRGDGFVSHSIKDISRKGLSSHVLSEQYTWRLSKTRFEVEKTMASFYGNDRRLLAPGKESRSEDMTRVLQFIEKINRKSATVLNISLTLAVLWIDLITGRDVQFPLLYIFRWA